jgi:hypothetical protein
MKRKFVSKSQNLMIVLKPGISANPLAGAPAQPGLSVRFQDGILFLDNEDIAEKLLASQAYLDGDFIEVLDGEVDPYKKSRKDSEPRHIIEELKYGHIEKTIGSPKTTEMQKLIAEEAVRLAKAMLPEMVKETIAQLQMDKHPSDPSKEAETNEAETLENNESVTAEEPKPTTQTTPSATAKGKSKK